MDLCNKRTYIRKMYVSISEIWIRVINAYFRLFTYLISEWRNDSLGRIFELYGLPYGRRGHTSAFGRRWACPEPARDDYAHVISDRKWPLKKIPVIAHIKARSTHSFLTINRNDLKN